MKNSGKLGWGSVLLLLLVTTIWRAMQVPAEQLRPYYNASCVVEGRIEPGSVKEGQYGKSLLLQVDALYVDGQKLDYKDKLRVFISNKQSKKEDNQAKEDYQYNQENQDERGQLSEVGADQQNNKFLNTEVKLKQHESGQQLHSVPTAGRLALEGQLTEIEGFRNPGSFDIARWCHVNGIGGSLSNAKVLRATSEMGIMDRLAAWNAQLRERLASTLPGPTGTLVSGMLLGGSGLDEETRELFTRNGLAHLLSVSGTHLVLLAGLLQVLLKKLKRGSRRIIIFSVLCFYTLLCGLKPPVLRALLMTTVTLWQGEGLNEILNAYRQSRGKTVQHVNNAPPRRTVLLLLVAGALLLYRPAWAMDIGFQLSFGAVASLVFLLDKIKLKLSSWLPPVLAEALAVTLSVQLGVLPLEVAYFNQVSLVSIISNLVLVPVLEFCVLGDLLACALLTLGNIFVVGSPSTMLGNANMSVNGFFTMLGNVFHPVTSVFTILSEAVLPVTSFFMNSVLVQANILSNLPYAVVPVPTLPLYCVPAYYLLLYIWLDKGYAQRLSNGQRRAVLLALSTALCLTACYVRWWPQPLTAYFLDVGQGDCTVVRTPTGKVVVVDTGGLKNYDTGSRILAPFLRTLGTARVDVLVLTHWDFDHVGGALGLVRNVEVGQVLLSQDRMTEANANLVRAIIAAYREKGAQLELAKAGTRCVFPKSELRVLSAGDGTLSGNGASTMAAVYDEAGGVVFTGDLPQEFEREALAKLDYQPLHDAQGKPLRIVAMKAGHHGSKYSTSDELLAWAKPEITVISCGRHNRYGHPQQEALDRITAAGSRIARVDQQGCIKIEIK